MLRDDFGIGQRAMARNVSRIAMDQMARFWEVAFGRQYENPLVRASARRMFYRARDDYETAKKVLENKA